jgi:hypothetical protein
VCPRLVWSYRKQILDERGIAVVSRQGLISVGRLTSAAKAESVLALESQRWKRCATQKLGSQSVLPTRLVVSHSLPGPTRCLERRAKRERSRRPREAACRRRRTLQLGSCEGSAPVLIGFGPIWGRRASSWKRSSRTTANLSACFTLSSAMKAQISARSANARGRTTTRDIYLRLEAVRVASRLRPSRFILETLHGRAEPLCKPS